MPIMPNARHGMHVRCPATWAANLFVVYDPAMISRDLDPAEHHGGPNMENCPQSQDRQGQHRAEPSSRRRAANGDNQPTRRKVNGCHQFAGKYPRPLLGLRPIDVPPSCRGISGRSRFLAWPDVATNTADMATLSSLYRITKQHSDVL